MSQIGRASPPSVPAIDSFQSTQISAGPRVNFAENLTTFFRPTIGDAGTPGPTPPTSGLFSKEMSATGISLNNIGSQFTGPASASASTTSLRRSQTSNAFGGKSSGILSESNKLAAARTSQKANKKSLSNFSELLLMFMAIIFGVCVIYIISRIIKITRNVRRIEHTIKTAEQKNTLPSAFDMHARTLQPTFPNRGTGSTGRSSDALDAHDSQHSPDACLDVTSTVCNTSPDSRLYQVPVQVPGSAPLLSNVCMPECPNPKEDVCVAETSVLPTNDCERPSEICEIDHCTVVSPDATVATDTKAETHDQSSFLVCVPLTSGNFESPQVPVASVDDAAPTCESEICVTFADESTNVDLDPDILFDEFEQNVTPDTLSCLITEVIASGSVESTTALGQRQDDNSQLNDDVRLNSWKCYLAEHNPLILELVTNYPENVIVIEDVVLDNSADNSSNNLQWRTHVTESSNENTAIAIEKDNSFSPPLTVVLTPVIEPENCASSYALDDHLVEYPSVRANPNQEACYADLSTTELAALESSLSLLPPTLQMFPSHGFTETDDVTHAVSANLEPDFSEMFDLNNVELFDDVDDALQLNDSNAESVRKENAVPDKSWGSESGIEDEPSLKQKGENSVARIVNEAMEPLQLILESMQQKMLSDEKKPDPKKTDGGADHTQSSETSSDSDRKANTTQRTRQTRASTRTVSKARASKPKEAAIPRTPKPSKRIRAVRSKASDNDADNNDADNNDAAKPTLKPTRQVKKPKTIVKPDITTSDVVFI